MRICSGRIRRRGLTLIEVIVLIALAAVVGAFVIWRINLARETFRGNTCRQNLRELAVALYGVQSHHGHYPGYLNVLEKIDGKLLTDPESGRPVPVSWVVPTFPYFERVAVFDKWREPTDAAGFASLAALPIPVLHCPSDGPRPDPLLNYVVNSGMPDAPTAVIDLQDSQRSIPRDWPANGVFFDRFSEHPLIKPDPQSRGPMVRMTFDKVRDVKSRTILLTENADAGSYVFSTARTSAEHWRAAEIDTGCIWRPGNFTSPSAPQLAPPVDTLQVNVGTGRGDGTNFDFCRPSSRHPSSVNVAFVEQNVVELRDTISYFVYVKLMTSDDEHIAPAGEWPSDAGLNLLDPQKFLREAAIPDELFLP